MLARTLRFTNSEYGKKAREIILNEVEKEPEEHVALFLSGGMDSSTVLFALREVGKQVTCYTVTLEGYLSTDYSYARRAAEKFGCTFRPVFLPTSPDAIMKDLKPLILRYHLKNKSEVEVMYVYDQLQRAVQENVIYTGFGGDDHFVISKRGMMHFKHTLKLQQENRLEEYEVTERQRDLLEKMSGKRIACPLLCQALRDLFWNADWDEINRPHQKQPWLDAFRDQFKQIRFQVANMHGADSMIMQNFEKLLRSKYNKRNSKSVIAIYNDIRKGII